MPSSFALLPPLAICHAICNYAICTIGTIVNFGVGSETTRQRLDSGLNRSRQRSRQKTLQHQCHHTSLHHAIATAILQHACQACERHDSYRHLVEPSSLGVWRFSRCFGRLTLLWPTHAADGLEYTSLAHWPAVSATAMCFHRATGTVSGTIAIAKKKPTSRKLGT